MNNYFFLECQECHNRKYIISKNKKSTEKRVHKKHCSKCLVHREHKEIKLK